MMKQSAQLSTVYKARRGVLFSLFYFYLCVLVGCGSSQEPIKLSGETMGTTYHIVVIPTPGQPLPKYLAKQIDNQLLLVNQHMSTYQADSEISHLNNSTTSEWQTISPMLAKVLSDALAISVMTQGALDITVGPLVDLWGFGPEIKLNNAPTDEDINALLADVGYEKLELKVAAHKLKKPEGIHLDLSAIAKGYGADVIGDLLESVGIDNYLIEIGGELLTRGVNAAGEPWRIGIEKPSLAHQGVQQAIGVSGKGVATSGDYRNYFEESGQRYSHIIDPRAGRPITNNLASVTVIAESAAIADGIATGLYVLGVDAALALAEEQGLAVYIIFKTATGFDTRHSSAFAAYLNEA